MNVIFLDFDGVLDTIHYQSLEDIERRIVILSEICKKYDCKVVIEASAKNSIDEVTMKTDIEWVQNILDLFRKYGIECIGRTPSVGKKYTELSYTSMWKEYEIRLYLFRHPEVEHYCIIDDDDLYPYHSDLNQVRDHLVKTILYSTNPEEEGLLWSHQDMVGEVLKRENNIRRLVLKNKKSFCK